MAKARVVKFCTQVGYMSSPSTLMTNHPWKGRGQGHVTNFKFCSPSDVSGTAKARVIRLCTQVDYIKSELSVDKAPLKEAWSQLPHDIFQLT